MELAGSRLQYLCCERDIPGTKLDLNFGNKIGSFRGLNGLELKNYDGRQLTSYLEEVSQLGLVELHLTKCRSLKALSFSSNSFIALQRLHVEDSPVQSTLRAEQAEAARNLRKLGGQLVALPCLQQLSGRSVLFDFAMPDYLKHWHLIESTDLKGDWWPFSYKMRVWRKPAARPPEAK